MCGGEVREKGRVHWSSFVSVAQRAACSSVLRFFGPSVLWSFGPLVLWSFGPLVLRSFRSPVIPSRRCRRCLIIASCSYCRTSTALFRLQRHIFRLTQPFSPSSSYTQQPVPPQEHLSTAKTRTSTRQVKRSSTTKPLKKSGEVR